jgi:hypothetical protein
MKCVLSNKLLRRRRQDHHVRTPVMISSAACGSASVPRFGLTRLRFFCCGSSILASSTPKPLHAHACVVSAAWTLQKGGLCESDDKNVATQLHGMQRWQQHQQQPPSAMMAQVKRVAPETPYAFHRSTCCGDATWWDALKGVPNARNVTVWIHCSRLAIGIEERCFDG